MRSLFPLDERGRTTREMKGRDTHYTLNMVTEGKRGGGDTCQIRKKNLHFLYARQGDEEPQGDEV